MESPTKTDWIESQYRFCPRCASRNPHPGQVPFKCETCGFASFFGPVAAVGAIIVNDSGEVLLVRRARNPGKGKWGLPGGFVDRDETVEEGLRREVQEEIGLELLSLRFLLTFPNVYLYNGYAAPVIDLFFECRVRESQEICLCEDELDHFEWVAPNEEQLSQMAFASNRRAIEHWLGTCNET